MTSHLMNRHQWVKEGSQLSHYKMTNIGVPQGSILGPLLFFYINVSPNVSYKFASVLFADDTKFLAKDINNGTLMVKINIQLNMWTKVLLYFLPTVGNVLILN